MKIAIASDDQLIIAQHFGRTKGFVIAELENGRVKEWKYRKIDLRDRRRELRESDHRSSWKSQVLAVLKDCDVLISHGFENQFFCELKSSGIEICFTEQMYVATAVNYYIAGILDKIPELCYEHD